MATSGSVDFTQTRNELITTAYKKVGLLQKGETPSSDEIDFASDILNIEVKYLMALNPHIWKRRVGYLFPEKDKFSYEVGTQSGDDNVFNSYVTTTTTANASASDTTVTVSSIVGISSTNIVGVTLDAGTIHWTTVNGAPSGSTVTLTDALPSAAASGSRLYVGAAKVNRPVKVYSYWRETLSSDDSLTRSPVEKVAYEDYYRRYGSQTDSSTPTHAMFDNRAVDASSTLNHGIINIQPSGDQSQEHVVIGFIYETMLEDFDASTDNPDFPSEWLKLLMLSVCMGLLTSDGVPERIANRIEKEYNMTLEVLLQNDTSDSYFSIEPAYQEQQGYYE